MGRRFAALALGLALAVPAAADTPGELYLDQSDRGLFGHWHSDIIVGIPTAARVQYRVADTPLWLEGGAGFLAFFPTAFAGVRAETGWELTGRHALSVRPGADVYYLAPVGSGGFFGRSRAAILGAIDVDLVWQARWTCGLAGEFGFKLGVLLMPGAFHPTPIGGLLLGLRF